MSPFSNVIGIMTFIAHPCVIQPQAISFYIAVARNAAVFCFAVHVVNGKTNAAFTVFAILFFIIAHFIHGILTSECVVLADSVVTDTHPHALFIFRADVACFTKAFIQSIYIDSVVIVYLAHVDDGFACVRLLLFFSTCNNPVNSVTITNQRIFYKIIARFIYALSITCTVIFFIFGISLIKIFFFYCVFYIKYTAIACIRADTAVIYIRHIADTVNANRCKTKRIVFADLFQTASYATNNINGLPAGIFTDIQHITL